MCRSNSRQRGIEPIGITPKENERFDKLRNGVPQRPKVRAFSITSGYEHDIAVGTANPDKRSKRGPDVCCLGVIDIVDVGYACDPLTAMG